VRGVAWTLPTTLASRVIGLVGTLLLARYLDPAEYGEVMATQIVVVTAFSVTTLGVGIYLLSHRGLTRAESFHATCLFLATGIAALATVWGLEGALRGWLDAPDLPRFLPLFLLATLLDRVAYLPERQLTRQLRFRWLSIARAAGELTFTGASLALAALGHGAMAIAWAYLARAALRLVAIAFAVPWRDWAEPHPLTRATLGEILRTGVTISVAGIATFLQRRADNLVVSASFGHATMGAYNYAYNLADTPAVAIGEQVSDVVAASFPHADAEKRKVAVVRACTMISLIMFPLAFGLGAVGQTVVATFFSAQWASVGSMLVLLAGLSAPRPIAHILHAYLLAGHRARVVLVQEWLSLAVLLGSITLVSALGIEAVCLTVGVAFVARTLLLMAALERLDGIPMQRFVAPLLRPLVACLVMVGAIVAARPALAGLPPVAQLGLEVLLGAVVYLAGARFIFRAAAAELVATLRASLGRRRG
jgi:PST family polysaccharide transporter